MARLFFGGVAVNNPQSNMTKYLSEFCWYLLFWIPFSAWFVGLMLIGNGAGSRSPGPVGAGVGAAILVVLAIVAIGGVVGGPLISMAIEKLLSRLGFLSESIRLFLAVFLPTVILVALMAWGVGLNGMPKAFSVFWSYLGFCVIPVVLVFIFLLVVSYFRSFYIQTNLFSAIFLLLAGASIGFSYTSFIRHALGFFQGSPRIDFMQPPSFIQRRAVAHFGSDQERLKGLVGSNLGVFLNGFFGIARTSENRANTVQRLHLLSAQWGLDLNSVCGGFFGLLEGELRVSSGEVECRRLFLHEMANPAFCKGLDLDFFSDFEPLLRELEEASPAAAKQVAKYYEYLRPFDPAPDFSQAPATLNDYLKQLQRD